MFTLGLQHGVRSDVERVVPRYALKLAGALGPLAAHWVQHPIGMVHTLCVSGNFGANYAIRVAIVLRTAHPANAAIRQQFHIKRARRRAIVRTGGVADVDRAIHGRWLRLCELLQFRQLCRCQYVDDTRSHHVFHFRTVGRHVWCCGMGRKRFSA